MFLFSIASTPTLRPSKPPTQRTVGTKRRGWGREADHSRSRMVELFLPCSVCLHGILLNYLSAGITLSAEWGSKPTNRSNLDIINFAITAHSCDVPGIRGGKVAEMRGSGIT
jgi:predicted transporter